MRINPNVIVPPTTTRRRDIEILLLRKPTTIQQRQNCTTNIHRRKLIIANDLLNLFLQNPRINRVNSLRTHADSLLMSLHLPKQKLNNIIVRRPPVPYQVNVVHERDGNPANLYI